MFCPASDIQISGSPLTSNKFATLVLQVRPCQTQQEINNLLTTSQIAAWSARALDFQTIYQSYCDSSSKQFFKQNRLVVLSDN